MEKRLNHGSKYASQLLTIYKWANAQGYNIKMADLLVITDHALSLNENKKLVSKKLLKKTTRKYKKKSVKE
jgi:hypothetical protein